jgi:TolA-binding protein
MPPSDEFTEKQVRLWEGKSYYHLGRIADANAVLKGYDLSNFSDEDLYMMVKLSLASKEVEKARNAAHRLERNPERFADALFDLGMFFRERKDADQARIYFTDVVQKCPESPRVPSARLEIAEMLLDGSEYAAAAGELEAVKEEDLEERKSSLLVSALFGAGRVDDATGLTEKMLPRLQKSPFGERAFRENLVHYYGKPDQENFKRFAGYLKKYPGTGNLVAYYSGRLDYDTGGYNSAYYSFYKLSSFANEYRTEALYRLGLISLYKQENRARAMTYFSRLAKEGAEGDIYPQKAKIILAIDAHQQGDEESARRHLAELMGTAGGRAILDQSMNLFEHFGFYKKAPKGK